MAACPLCATPGAPQLPLKIEAISLDHVALRLSAEPVLDFLPACLCTHTMPSADGFSWAMAGSCRFSLALGGIFKQNLSRSEALKGGDCFATGHLRRALKWRGRRACTSSRLRCGVCLTSCRSIGWGGDSWTTCLVSQRLPTARNVSECTLLSKTTKKAVRPWKLRRMQHNSFSREWVGMWLEFKCLACKRQSDAYKT